MIIVEFKKKYLVLLLVLSLALSGCILEREDAKHTQEESDTQNITDTQDAEFNNIPAYAGKPYVFLNNNEPLFLEKDYTTDAFEIYGDLDEYKRCTVAYANVCKETMPTEKIGKIGYIFPSGWVSVKYDFVDGKFLYNRCHLIGYQLTGETANEKNLITGTRYLNINGMLPFENLVADYVNATGNHVLYRVTPVFDGDNLVASGVKMEAKSVEDKGKGICFNVFCYNVQPGVIIDYKTGKSIVDSASEESTENVIVETTVAVVDKQFTYVLNTSKKRFHYPACQSVKDMSEKNKREVEYSREEIISQGYLPCGNCKP